MNLPIVRLVLALSLDGRLAFSTGGKSNLGGKGDRKVLEKALAWSDATLMGNGTLRSHQNICLIHNTNLINKRRKEGKDSQPTSIVVSKSSIFSNQWEYFKQPIKRLLLQTDSKNHPNLTKGFENSLIMKKSWSETLIELKQKGFSKIVLLGGVKLINSILSEDNIDELQLTITPRIIGGTYTWIDSELKNIPEVLTKSSAWILTEMKDLGSSEIMLLYQRNKS